jgi:hypothetical protein
MPTGKKSPKKMTRSARLKRYESAYTKAIKRGVGSACKHKVRKAPQKSPRRRPKTKKKNVRMSPKHKPNVTHTSKRETKKANKCTKRRSKRLTDYQKFVRTESKKTKYKGMAPKDRMTAIGVNWNVLKTKK